MDYIKENIQQQDKNLNKYYEDLKSNKIFGWTCGFKGIDGMVGRIKEASLWVIGAYTGVGKSFTLLNMIEGLLKECAYYVDQEDRYKIPKVVIFSTELTTEAYMVRHIFMRLGAFKLNLENSRDPHKIEEFKSEKDKYFEERYLNPYLPLIIGEVRTYEEIIEHLNNLDFKPDIVYIDYIQDLTVSVNGKLLVQEEDVMPVLSANFSRLAKNSGTAFVYFSQVNNYTVSLDSKTSKLQPFSNGKQLAQTADVTLVLSRRKNEGEYCPVLEMDVYKARDGRSGRIGCLIKEGYQLEELSKEEAEHKVNKFLGTLK